MTEENPSKNQEYRRLYMRRYYETHGDSMRANNARSYARHREKRIAKVKEYACENASLVRQYQKIYRQRTKGKHAEYKRIWEREWRKNYPEKAREKCKRHRLKRGRRILTGRSAASSKNWKLRNKHRVRAYCQKRRAIKAKCSIGNQSAIERFILMVRSSKTINCYYCGNPTQGNAAHIDHVVALSRHGNHAIENLAASCQTCNLTKHAKTISEWKKPGQQILDF